MKEDLESLRWSPSGTCKHDFIRSHCPDCSDEFALYELVIRYPDQLDELRRLRPVAGMKSDREEELIAYMNSLPNKFKRLCQMAKVHVC